ncbi:MAG: hypothetical protein ABJO01_00140 [Parasphingorhabdus sp.]|uniref:hypothetical protein n=1 Tax=Parasphingorhabdus sp. TaxID=2709688 RepID=UPI0032976423
MKKTYAILSVVAAAITVSGCLAQGYGAPLQEPPPREEAPIYETEVRYIGTAPFCAARKGDCYNLGRDWEFDSFTKSGTGATCATGTKAKCVRRVQVN